LDFLDLLEATALNEGTLGFKISGKDFSELSANIGENIVGSELKERLKSREMSAHLDNVLKSFLGLILKLWMGSSPAATQIYLGFAAKSLLVGAGCRV
jgi:hypothetical protein